MRRFVVLGINSSAVKNMNKGKHCNIKAGFRGECV
jgi:hypothetical protein